MLTSAVLQGGASVWERLWPRQSCSSSSQRLSSSSRYCLRWRGSRPQRYVKKLHYFAPLVQLYSSGIYQRHHHPAKTLQSQANNQSMIPGPRIKDVINLNQTNMFKYKNRTQESNIVLRIHHIQMHIQMLSDLLTSMFQSLNLKTSIQNKKKAIFLYCHNVNAKQEFLKGRTCSDKR